MGLLLGFNLLVVELECVRIEAEFQKQPINPAYQQANLFVEATLKLQKMPLKSDVTLLSFGSGPENPRAQFTSGGSRVRSDVLYPTDTHLSATNLMPGFKWNRTRVAKVFLSPSLIFGTGK